jgi:hypothetical protein
MERKKVTTPETRKEQVRCKEKENDENKKGSKEMRKEWEKRGANEKKKQG